VKPGSVRPNQRLQEASRCVWGGQEVDPRRIGISAGAKRAVANMGAGLPRDFHTAWANCCHSRLAMLHLAVATRAAQRFSIMVFSVLHVVWSAVGQIHSKRTP